MTVLLKGLKTVPHVVIVGGGFGGLYAAKALGKSPVRLTLIDKRNFHLFQPLLYQVATGCLSPGDIASPLRTIVECQKNTQVLMAEVVDLDPAHHKVILQDGEIAYDYLVLATGSTHSYFGKEEWASRAPGLKTVEDATLIRSRILTAFEQAEREPDPARRRRLLTFVIAGGGPTGVELAGAIGELVAYTMRNEFRTVDPLETRIILVEGTDRILGVYPPELSQRAVRELNRLGVSVRTGCLVTDVGDDTVRLKCGDREETLEIGAIFWAAGVKASPLGLMLHERAGVAIDRPGRVIVEPDLSVPGYPEIFVVGDLAHYAHQDEHPLPGVAPVAMQEGAYVARLIHARVTGTPEPSRFHYKSRGNLAVIGRNEAVADLGGKLRFGGFLAWLIWAAVHIRFLVEFENRVLVFLQWAWAYLTQRRSARLITETAPGAPGATGARTRREAVAAKR